MQEKNAGKDTIERDRRIRKEFIENIGKKEKQVEERRKEENEF